MFKFIQNEYLSFQFQSTDEFCTDVGKVSEVA